MKKLFYVLLFLSSCNINKEDQEFKLVFFKNISLIERVYNYEDSLNRYNLLPSFNDDSIYYRGVYYAYEFNGLVTGIEFSPLNFEGDHMVYMKSKDQFDTIINKWKNWYDQNKYNMTLKKADSIYFEGFGAFQSAYDILYEEGYPTGYSISNHECYIKFLEDSLRQEFRKNYK